MKTKSYFKTIEVAALDSISSRGLQFVTVQSPALKRRVDLTIYLPPGVKAKEKLPLAILLHGVYGSHWAWALQGGVTETVARLVKAKKISPMIVAMPSDGHWGEGSGYLNHAGGDFEKWILEEVPRAVSEATSRIDLRAKMALGGLSMGGFGAMLLGAKHPSRFFAISGHSSITDFSQMKKFVKTPLNRYRISKKDESVFDRMVANRKKLPPYRFDCGADDLLIQENRTLHRALDRARIPHVYEEFPGKHEWTYWKKHVERTLLFFDHHRNQ